MRIEQLKPSQRVSGRWLAVLDDGSILRLTQGEVVDFALYAGKELTDDEGQALARAARHSGLKEKTVELLTRKPMSRRELEQKLDQWQAGEEETQSICERMEQLGFLNDEQYAAQVVRHYSARGYGEAKLRDELYRRGVPRDLWDQALEQADDPEGAVDAFLEQKLKGSHDPKLMKKTADALARRGFSWSQIREGLQRYGAEVDED